MVDPGSDAIALVAATAANSSAAATTTTSVTSQSVVEVALSTPNGRFTIARKIEREMLDQGLNRQKLAAKAVLSIDAINDVFNRNKPICSVKTFHKLEKALDKKFIEDEEDDAPEALGGYSAKDAKRYVGEYLCIRPAFDNQKYLNVYLIDIIWDKPQRRLRFQERKRWDAQYEQSGEVYIPDALPYMSLLTIDAGDLRHIVVSRTSKNGILRGLVQTLWDQKGEHSFMPVSSPIVLRKTNGNAEKECDLGKVDHKKPMYKQYKDMLAEVLAKDFVRQISVIA